MEASKLFVPGTAVTWQERAVAVEAQKNAVIAELQRQLQAARIATGVVRDDRERLVKEVAELNLRLIERQESHLVQVVRIEETWRGKLREVREEKNTKLLAVAEKCFITGYETAMGEEANYDAALKRWIESLVKMDLETECQLAPAGWQCTREVGHEGPCAAVESGVKP